MLGDNLEMLKWALDFIWLFQPCFYVDTIIPSLSVSYYEHWQKFHMEFCHCQWKWNWNKILHLAEASKSYVQMGLSPPDFLWISASKVLTKVDPRTVMSHMLLTIVIIRVINVNYKKNFLPIRLQSDIFQKDALRTKHFGSKQIWQVQKSGYKLQDNAKSHMWHIEWRCHLRASN